MNNIDYDELQGRVQKRLKRQKVAMRWSFVAANALLFLVFMVTLIAVASNPESAMAHLSDSEKVVLLLPLILWPIAILMQFGNALVESGVMDKRMSADIISKELGSQILENQLQNLVEKAKRGRLDDEAMTISDDGELVPLEYEAEARRSARQ